MIWLKNLPKQILTLHSFIKKHIKDINYIYIYIYKGLYHLILELMK